MHDHSFDARNLAPFTCKNLLHPAKRDVASVISCNIIFNIREIKLRTKVVSSFESKSLKHNSFQIVNQEMISHIHASQTYLHLYSERTILLKYLKI